MASLEGVHGRSQSQKEGGGIKVFPAIERCNSARMESRLCSGAVPAHQHGLLRAYKAATLSACPALNSCTQVSRIFCMTAAKSSGFSVACFVEDLAGDWDCVTAAEGRDDCVGTQVQKGPIRESVKRPCSAALSYEPITNVNPEAFIGTNPGVETFRMCALSAKIIL
jgi:hypothetical protein